MHVLISTVGKRTEHWTSLFTALAARDEVQLTILAADITDISRQELTRLARERTNVRCHVVPYRIGEDRTGHMASVLYRREGLRLAAAGPPPDVVFVVNEPAYLSTWQILRLRRRCWPRVPVTAHTAQNIAFRLPGPFPLIERYAYREIDHILPCTPAAEEVVRMKGYRGRTSLVPLGVDTGMFRPAGRASAQPFTAGSDGRASAQPFTAGSDGRASAQPFTAGFVGRLAANKGLGDLLCAAEMIDCDLLLVGDGPLRPEIERAAARRPGRVTLYGWADHAALPGLLARMDALVLPSVELIQRNVVRWIGIPWREQFGRVLVEAMACGVPTVGSDSGEIPYVIGDAGLIFPAGNAAALADRLARLRDDPELARRLGAVGAARAGCRFSWDRIADVMGGIWAGETGLPWHARPTAVPPAIGRQWTGPLGAGSVSP